MTEQDMAILGACSLFEGFSVARLRQALSDLGGKVRGFGKGEAVFREGDPANAVGVVLEGEIQVYSEDYYGVRRMMTVLPAGEIFGEVFACAEVEALPVSAVAVRDSRVMLFDCRPVTLAGRGENTEEYYVHLTRNLLHIMARKNLMLNRKIELLSKRTTREKLLFYLHTQAKTAKSDRFTIPYDRQQLADYLGVERSAMSEQLGKLRREGVIECNKNHFHLLRSDPAFEKDAEVSSGTSYT